MAEPIVFISVHRIKPGALAGLKEMASEMMSMIAADKPRTAFQYGYLDEESARVTFVHVFPDGEAMDLHMMGAGERTDRAYEFLEPESFVVYGKPTARFMETMGQTAGTEFDLSIWPHPLAGYVHLASS